MLFNMFVFSHPFYSFTFWKCIIFNINTDFIVIKFIYNIPKFVTVKFTSNIHTFKKSSTIAFTNSITPSRFYYIIITITFIDNFSIYTIIRFFIIIVWRTIFVWSKTYFMGIMISRLVIIRRSLVVIYNKISIITIVITAIVFVIAIWCYLYWGAFFLSSMQLFMLPPTTKIIMIMNIKEPHPSFLFSFAIIVFLLVCFLYFVLINR